MYLQDTVKRITIDGSVRVTQDDSIRGALTYSSVTPSVDATPTTKQLVIVADKSGTELRALVFSSYDIEVGTGENSFRFYIKRHEYEAIPEGARMYIPDTEYGGLFRQLQTDTKEDVIVPGGLTWRGMLQKKIIVPPAGDDYAKDSGELNNIVRRRVEAALPGMFIGSDEDTGVSVTNFQYNRYCTLEEGLTKLLKSVGYRLELKYSQVDKAVQVSAVPIVDYSQYIEFSSDMQLNYTMQMQGDGVNHLICLGNGELKDREVYHLYVDKNGNIGTTQYYTGVDEIVEVYDSAGAELPDLIQGGQQRLEEVMNTNLFNINIESGLELAVGDIVGGKDYLSRMKMTAPIAGKVVRWEDGFQTIEYTLEDDIAVGILTDEEAQDQKSVEPIEELKKDAVDVSDDMEDKK